jgi:hypothetical protein
MLVCFRRWSLIMRLAPVLLAVMGSKVVFHYVGWEYLDLNLLFSSLLSATIFIFGFILSGVLSDYKESEKLPGELASGLDAIFDESYLIFKRTGSEAATECMRYSVGLAGALRQWFYRAERTKNIYSLVSGLNDHFLALEPLAQPTFMNRLKIEQTNIRRAVTRIHTIRETEFVSSAYAIGEILAFSLIIGLILVHIEPFYESMFFTFLVTFLVTYMLILIRELDNPFDYQECGQNLDSVSIKPLTDTEARLKSALAELTGRS